MSKSSSCAASIWVGRRPDSSTRRSNSASRSGSRLWARQWRLCAFPAAPVTPFRHTPSIVSTRSWVLPLLQRVSTGRRPGKTGGSGLRDLLGQPATQASQKKRLTGGMDALPAASGAGDVMVWLPQNRQRLGNSAPARAIVLDWLRDTRRRLSGRYELEGPPVAKAWSVTGIGPILPTAAGVRRPTSAKYPSLAALPGGVGATAELREIGLAPGPLGRPGPTQHASHGVS